MGADSKELSAGSIGELLQESAYSHPVREPRLIETHISWVILTGDFAYKLKKAVSFGFLDFSTLALRKHYCEEEVRLNRRFAPDLYLGVVPVRSRHGGLSLGDAGDIVDYAVRMRQFDEEALLSCELETGRFGTEQAKELGHWLAALHAGLPVREPPAAGEPGSPESVLTSVRQNFAQIGDVPAEIIDWSFARHRAIEDRLRRRAVLGFVRESHGDLHLGNIARLDGRLVPFDCIEFSEHFRVLDFQSELAIVLMDLERRARRSEASLCFNAYLETSGDYGGVGLSDYFRCYYALVRAKVLRLETGGAGLEEYLALARGYGRPRHPALWLMHGVSGSGKTTVAEHLFAEIDAIRIRADVERKRLFGLAPLAQSGSRSLNEGIYSAEATDATYRRLAELAGIATRSGRHCIVDAAFLDAARRRQFRDLAAELGVPIHIVSCRARAETLHARVAARSTGKANSSEAGAAVLEHQLAHHEPLAAEERQNAVVVDTESDDWQIGLAESLRRIAG